MSCESKSSIGGGGGSTGVSLSLPVVKTTPPRPKSGHGRRSRWRWIVLITVQVLMIVHVVQWWVTGKTSTPIEPSEAMATVKDGVINMGAIFFALALLSTAIFGRWMCGWMCHVVLLQDGCGAMLRRIGIRPKPFRSRLLLWLPLLLALYMFVWPVVYRLAVAPWTRPDLTWSGWQLNLATENFWGTFPGVMLAIPFLGICGFLAVYLLGSKGYCTYGCPYGGFFAPLDEVAPMRIRVTDSCEQCGHCTAVCTSNVRVHEEVRDFGMVVDPGCMKCMDCVDVCPKDALYVGWGRPAQGAKPRVDPADVKQRKWDLSWPEEFAIALIAALSLFAMRGIGNLSLYGLFPLLMASGVTICVAWFAWLSWRLLRGRVTHLHGMRLRAPNSRGLSGLHLKGWIFVWSMAMTAALLVHSVVVMGAYTLATISHDRVTMTTTEVFVAALEPDEATRRHAERGERMYALASSISDGGIGLGWGWQPRLSVDRAWMLAVQRKMPEAEAILRRTIERHGNAEDLHIALVQVIAADFRPLDAEAALRNAIDVVGDRPRLHEGLVQFLVAQERRDEAIAHGMEVVNRHPEFTAVFETTARLLQEEQRIEELLDFVRRTHAAVPDDLTVMRRLSLLLVLFGEGMELDEGIALIRETLRIAPDNAAAHFWLALALGKRGDLDEAEIELRRAIELDPDNQEYVNALVELQTERLRPQ